MRLIKVLHPVHWHKTAGENRYGEPRLYKGDIVVIFERIDRKYSSDLYGFSRLGPGWLEIGYCVIEDFWMSTL